MGPCEIYSETGMSWGGFVMTVFSNNFELALWFSFTSILWTRINCGRNAIKWKEEYMYWTYRGEGIVASRAEKGKVYIDERGNGAVKDFISLPLSVLPCPSNPTTRILQDQSFFFFFFLSFFFFSVTPRVPPPISLDISQTWSNGFLQSF